VLGVLTAEQLAHAMFPLGATPSKDEVRAEAAARGLTVAQKPDSHDICFIPDGDTRGWLADRVGAEPGAILDRSGERIGTHEGATAFTVGQRKGLNIGFPSDDGKPRFVLEVRPKTNEVVVGPREALAISELAGSRFTWAGMPPAAPEVPFDCEVQVRAHGDPVPAVCWLSSAAEGDAYRNRELVVQLKAPLDGVAPGQTAVIYLGTRVLGQCTIDRTVSAVLA
jgi:tRNA-specific 2-thiouridylase